MAQSVITPQEMYEAERAVFATGRASFELMQEAGRGVADVLQSHYPEGSISVLCGPGGNGGDGFIAAAHLANLGREVSVFLSGSVDALKGDPKRAAAQWPGPIGSLSHALDASADITLDALFGGGLTRPLNGPAVQLAEASRAPVISVDVPSGLDGATGRPLGSCFQAALTVTFAALRPAHVLSPGRRLSGQVEVIDIGVPVPAHTLYRDPTPSELERAQTFLSLEDVRDVLADPSVLALSAIECMRALAKQTGEAVYVTHPDRILARPDGMVVIAPSTTEPSI
ncbi:MAG: NAD(P)H-hydrate epimerase [Pseudomonadota bacterium]